MREERKTPSRYAELIAHLESVGWRADARGDVDCVDQGAAMAADAIRQLETELEAARRDAQRYRALRAQFEGEKFSVLLPMITDRAYLEGWVTYSSGEAFDSAVDAALRPSS